MIKDPLSLLPPFQWRGSMYPVTSRDVSFTHDGVRHKFQFRDGEAIEQTGAQALTFRYVIPMREGLAKGPYKNYFTKQLPILFADCFNRERGILYDPIYGQFNCVPTSYGDTTDVTKRDGTDITVEFTKSLVTGEADSLPKELSLPGLISEAGALDAALKDTKFEQIASEDGTVDVLSAIAGVGAQIQQQGQALASQLENYANKMQLLEEQIDRTEDPSQWGIQRGARNAREAALRLIAKGANPGERIQNVTKNSARTIGQICAEESMALTDFIRLNPHLLAAPLVPPGVPIRVSRKP